MGEFEAFFHGEYPRLVRVLMLTGASLDEAMDVAQDTFIDAYSKWDMLKAPSAWVRRVAFRGFFKQRERTRRGVEIASQSLTLGLDIEQSAEQAVLGHEEEGRVSRLLDELPPTQRMVLALRFDGLSTKEISDLLGKSPEAIRKNLQLARQRLKELTKANESGRR
ncbi:RNA polymerase sigma factor [Streptosporangium sp. NPDC050855]|uniref:RNA polymerase sigma factor n=1 Tax=Streptosporangium sp. NPDC050855 TaxID=3366194 RepID=UPI0037BB9445